LTAAEEARLIAGAKLGDHASFEALVDRFMARAVTVAAGYVHNRDEALDLAQEAFYRVYKNLDRFRDGEPFAPWFFRILRNACMNYLEKHRKPRTFSIHAGEDAGADPGLSDPSTERPEHGAEAKETRQLLFRALESLPLPHREIIMLRHFEELEYSAIARVLDIPIGTVMSRLFHARRKLRAAFEALTEGSR
jgi:RNA polymerase sigma-70 factor (ECF subfamily)